MIRKAEDKDLDRIAELELELFPSHPWKKQDFANELHLNPYSTVYVYEEDEIYGYVILWIMFEQAEIANIGVAEAKQRNHIGDAMMAYCIQEAVKADCENLTLEVRVSNYPAIGLYEKYGFIRVNIRKNYYENGEDAYLMLKPLGGLKDDDAAGN